MKNKAIMLFRNLISFLNQSFRDLLRDLKHQSKTTCKYTMICPRNLLGVQYRFSLPLDFIQNREAIVNKMRFQKIG